MVDVTSLAHAAGTDVAQVLTDALLDAPGWRDTGPDRTHHRRLVTWHHHRMLYRKALRWGRPGYAAWQEGRLIGVAVVFDSDGWPPPEPISTLLDIPAFALAGVGAAARGARAGAIMKRAHFDRPHVYLSQLAVDPSAQRSGIGQYPHDTRDCGRRCRSAPGLPRDGTAEQRPVLPQIRLLRDGS